MHQLKTKKILFFISKIILPILMTIIYSTVHSQNINDMEYFSLDYGRWLKVNTTLEIHTARNEAESIILRLKNAKSSNFKIKLYPLSKSKLNIELFLVKEKPNNQFGVMDAIEPINKESNIYIDSNDGIILIKSIVPNFIPPGSYSWRLSIYKNNHIYYNGVIKIFIYSPILKKITSHIQGNILFKRKDINESIILEILHKMKDYNFDSVILPRRVIKSKRYSLALNYANNNFTYIRLPPQKLFTRKKTMSYEMKKQQISPKEWLNKECNYLRYTLKNLRQKKIKAIFTYKLWDEPIAKNYKEVYFGYQGIRSCIKNIKLEITEEPSYNLGDIADIWTININKLNQDIVNKAHNTGDWAYLYANYLHSISNNPYRSRIIGWILDQYNLDGYHFWSISNWKHGMFYQNRNINNREERGTFFYYNKKVYSSLRIESFREGLEDMQLLKQVRECQYRKPQHTTTIKNVLLDISQMFNTWNINNKKSTLPNFFKFRKILLKIAEKCQ